MSLSRYVRRTYVARGSVTCGDSRTKSYRFSFEFDYEFDREHGKVVSDIENLAGECLRDTIPFGEITKAFIKGYNTIILEVKVP